MTPKQPKLHNVPKMYKIASNLFSGKGEGTKSFTWNSVQRGKWTENGEEVQENKSPEGTKQIELGI